MINEKNKIALHSIIATLFLTSIKFIVGFLTGSLSIISEAAHSGLDLAASFVTFWAVRISDKPADENHTYGHGKIESFAALIETLLLLITAIWIIYEGINRIINKNFEVDINIYSFLVMIITVGVSIQRAIVLNKAAKKYNSAALKADSINFTSDIYTSVVVVIGLIFSYFGYYFADSVAAIGVSMLVAYSSYKLGKETIAVLVDTAPKGIPEDIKRISSGVQGVLEVKKVRVRQTGTQLFIELLIGLHRYENHQEIHRIIKEIHKKILSKYSNSDISISTYPMDIKNMSDNNEIFYEIKKICYDTKGIKNAHNIRIYNVDDKKLVSLHVETDTNIGFTEAHELVHEIKAKIETTIKNIYDVSIELQHPSYSFVEAKDVTGNEVEMIRTVKTIINEMLIAEDAAHDIRVYKHDNKHTVFFHCYLFEEYNLKELEELQIRMVSEIKSILPSVDYVNIHFEPKE